MCVSFAWGVHCRLQTGIFEQVFTHSRTHAHTLSPSAFLFSRALRFKNQQAVPRSTKKTCPLILKMMPVGAKSPLALAVTAFLVNAPSKPRCVCLGVLGRRSLLSLIHTNTLYEHPPFFFAGLRFLFAPATNWVLLSERVRLSWRVLPARRSVLPGSRLPQCHLPAECLHQEVHPRPVVPPHHCAVCARGRRAPSRLSARAALPRRASRTRERESVCVCVSVRV